MMYYDVDDLTSPVNDLANRIAAATPSYKHEEACTEAPKSAAGYRGNIVIVSSPTSSEVGSSSGIHGIVNAQFDTTFTMSRLQKELMFFKTEECIKKGKRQDTVGGRCYGGLPPDLIPQIPSSGHGYYIHSTVGKPVKVKKIKWLIIHHLLTVVIIDDYYITNYCNIHFCYWILTFII